MTDSDVLTSSVQTPIGPFSFTVLHGKVIEATFGRPQALRRRGRVVRDIPKISTSIRSYFAGEIRALDKVPVEIEGTLFRRRVLRKMRGIKAGKTLSYQGLAKKVGSPRASRAVGTACATNSIPLIIPCHRVIPSNGSIGHYGYGKRKKAWLLQFEGALTRD
ncbi:MAG: methylated-DNA--[protein]-cysteine S-methyltransferase [Candidatus Nanopelagicaceae bacterium]